jgi:Transposase DDE domain group 1
LKIEGSLSLPSRAIVQFYNKRRTAEQWSKEGKQATHWTRLSCHRFRANEARLQLSLLAYNLGNLWRRLVLPKRIDDWSLTSLQQRLVKTGGRLVKHARYYWLLLAEGHLHRGLFGQMLRRIESLPVPTGSAPVHYLQQVASKQVSGGGFPPVAVNENEGETNHGGWTTLIGPVIVGTPPAATTSITLPPKITTGANRSLGNRSSAKLPSVAAGSAAKAAMSSAPHKHAAPQLNLPPVVFYRDTDMYAGDFVFPQVPTNGQSCGGDPIAVCAEPSGAAAPGGTAFTSSNCQKAPAGCSNAWSVDGVFESGVNAPEPSFHPVDPSTVFPAGEIPLCCDQVVQYAPTIDRFIWVMQLWDVNNGSAYRIAVSSPADIATHAGTSWTYWDLPASFLTSPFNISIPTLDYPDLSIGNNYVYLSFNIFTANSPSEAVAYGHEVARISLAQLQAGGSLQIAVTDPADCTMCWGSHLTQDTLDAAFWAGHKDTSDLRVFSMTEGDNSYSWQDVPNPTYNKTGYSSKTPDGRDWLAWGFPGDAVIGSTRVLGPKVVTGNAPPPETYDLWFAWTAGPINKLPQPYIALVEVDQNLNFVASGAIWGSLAYSYPALATNLCTQEVGVSLVAGGNGYYQHHEVGFLDDGVLYATTVNSNVGADRWGDYVTIRQAPLTKLNPGNLFLAFGFGTFNNATNRSPVAGGVATSVRYVVFGRQGCPVIQ